MSETKSLPRSSLTLRNHLLSLGWTVRRSSLEGAYGEAGVAVSGGWHETREAAGAVATSVEVLETGGDVIGEILEAGVSIPGAQALGGGEAWVDIADVVIPGDGFPFVDLNLPEKPGWWPGG